MKSKAIAASILMLFAAFFVSCSSSDKSDASNKFEAAKSGANVSKGAFSVLDIGGNLHNIDEYIGKSPLIVNFWGTWCPPCRKELPDLKRIYDEYRGQGLEIIGFAVNDTPQKVRAFAPQFGLEWVLLMANNDAIRYFRIGTAVPVTIFIDRNGNEIGRFVGMRTYNDFKAEVQKII